MDAVSRLYVYEEMLESARAQFRRDVGRNLCFSATTGTRGTNIFNARFGYWDRTSLGIMNMIASQESTADALLRGGPGAPENFRA